MNTTAQKILSLKVCPDCLKTFHIFGRSLSRRRYCSKQCAESSNRKRVYDKLVRKYAARSIVQRSCLYCGKVMQLIFHQERIFCSKHCLKKSYKRNTSSRTKALRYARIRAAMVEHVHLAVLLERDGYTCQICYEFVDTNEEVPHPKAPTIDHIIPLSKGGLHGYENVQLAHFRCNSLRRDKSLKLR